MVNLWCCQYLLILLLLSLVSIGFYGNVPLFHVWQLVINYTTSLFQGFAFNFYLKKMCVKCDEYQDFLK